MSDLLPRGDLVALTGAVVIGMGAVLPWVAVDGAQQPGISDDGLALLFLVVAVVGIVFVRGWKTLDHVFALLIGGSTTLLAASRYRSIGEVDRALGEAAAVDPGAGIYVSALGGLVVAAGGAIALYRDFELPDPPGPDELDDVE